MMEPPVVVILNSNDDVVEMLRLAIEQAHLVAVSASLSAIRRGRQRLTDLVLEHDPQVIVYDLAPPYDRSWRFLEHLRRSPHLHGRNFIVTSANAQRARTIVADAVHVFEIAGRPTDIRDVVNAILRVVGLGEDLPPEARHV